MWGPQMIGKLVNINLQAMHQLSLQNNKHLRKCVMTCADFAQQLRLKGLNVEVMRSTVGSQQSSRALCTFTQHHHKIPAWWRKLFAQLLWSRLSCLSLTDAGSPWQRFQREFGSFPLLLSTFLYAKEKGNLRKGSCWASRHGQAHRLDAEQPPGFFAKSASGIDPEASPDRNFNVHITGASHYRLVAV